jgi:hypothetical protein
MASISVSHDSELISVDALLSKVLCCDSIEDIAARVSIRRRRRFSGMMYTDLLHECAPKSNSMDISCFVVWIVVINVLIGIRIWKPFCPPNQICEEVDIGLRRRFPTAPGSIAQEDDWGFWNTKLRFWRDFRHV